MAWRHRNSPRSRRPGWTRTRRSTKSRKGTRTTRSARSGKRRKSAKNSATVRSIRRVVGVVPPRYHRKRKSIKEKVDMDGGLVVIGAREREGGGFLYHQYHHRVTVAAKTKTHTVHSYIDTHTYRGGGETNQITVEIKKRNLYQETTAEHTTIPFPRLVLLNRHMMVVHRCGVYRY